MKKIVVYGGLEQTATEFLSLRDDIFCVWVNAHETEKLKKEVQSADGLILRYLEFGEDVISKAEQLKIISRTGVGCDNIDVEAATQAGIPVMTTGNVTSRAVAEHAVTLMLSAAKQIRRYDSAVRSGEFSYRESLDSVELDGRQALIVGFGRIGRRVAELCQALGMRVTIFDPFVDAIQVTEAGFEYHNSLDDAIVDADVISLHAPKAPDGGYLLTAERLKAVKRGVVIVNTARGGLIDEAALSAALESGRVFAAGVDVYSAEPVAADNPMLVSERALLTPHCAAQTQQGMARMCYGAAKNVLNFFDNEYDRNLIVNPITLKA